MQNIRDFPKTKLDKGKFINMTGGDKDIEGVWKFLDTRKGGSEKIRGGSENLYTSKPTGEGGAPKKLNY